MGHRRERSKGYPERTLELGELVAEIIADRQAHPRIYHWVIQRRGDPEILMMGQELTLQAAEREARSSLEYLRKPARRRPAAA